MSEPPSNPDFDQVVDALSEGRSVDWNDLESDEALSSQEVWALRALATVRGGATAASDELELPPSLADRLELREVLGEGAFARVYRCEDTLLQRDVALKVFTGEAIAAVGSRDRFLREARTLASMKHPNIVQIHWVDESEGRIHLILELIEGKTIGWIVDEEGPLVPQEAARIGTEICRALAAMHAKSLVHMDVKPANIAREAGGRIVLLDFGFARASAMKRGLDAPLGGTPLFMSPEILEGRDQIPPSSDIYSVGVLLYWLVSGRYPHEADTFNELREQILEQDPRPLVDARSDVPPEYAAIVAKALSRDESERYPTAGALEEALRRFVDPKPATPWPSWLGWVIGPVAALLLALVVVVGVGVGPFGPEVTTLAAVEPLEFGASFFATRDGTGVLLEPDAEVFLGDRLHLEVEASEAIYLYVFNEDEHGRAHTLHPVPKLDLLNPLVGGDMHRLPRTSAWVIDTEGGGAEYFLIAASTEPIAMMEKLREWIPDVESALPEAVSFRGLTAQTRGDVLRGVGQITGREVAAPNEQPGRLEEIFGQLERELAPGTTVVRRIRLSH
jgi:tRNA A-37 threonylcarbamoyl transferase component Bud32